MRTLQDEVFVDDDMVGIAAEGVRLSALGAVVGTREAVRPLTILLQPFLAGRAGPAAVHHAADADEFPRLNVETSEPTAVTRPTIS